MTLTLYAHPFASYCWKALIALYESGTPFTFRLIDLGDAASASELERLWPFKKFPVLINGEKSVIESTIIIEYLDLHYPGPARLVPVDATDALDVRFADRFFDNYVQTPMQAIVSDALRGDRRDPDTVAHARANLDTAYAWLEGRMANREWVSGDHFSLADCSAAPALFYADWAHPIGNAFPSVRAYRARLNARPSVARTIDEARPYRHFFPLGAPDCD
ncbi:glutathione S-transferase family protein [Sphingomonas paeninsulae]|jgi:glutathione S-transferase|uniref:Glutathione S-transferase family protein n=1 Tax=Sphingomonas paeninsulae TaxID=2319844 RepID=A0A494TP71_SPHPE|nr:glutathione S-transferase family protein [Sphingomonas paeninsulae]AYJ86865.1 glutathione S-transferase family protein [Sphingomonas paeninsulae]